MFENSNLNEVSSTVNSKAGLGENAYNGRQSITSTVGVNNESYAYAQITLRAPYNLNNATRAMVGFDNAGNNAGVLYLDIDGRLKWHGADGTEKIIDWT